jgi:uncharacterized protein
MSITLPQRIRDPVHNLIEFGTTVDSDQRQLEQVLWRVIQTRPFQRLRRIKQLGFGELVFPGATHTRFAHSIGVFHAARQLVGAIRRSISANSREFDAHQARVAVAAALVHDVGHGMFSHSFEKFGEHFRLPMAHHETVSDLLICDDEISSVLATLGRSFAAEVADMVKAKQPESLYASVVSSQFDADRLDYMQRDRLMTGVQSSDVDATWLLANLEVGRVNTGSEDAQTGSVETLVLGSKARQTAESYVVSILHLYQNVYGHKTTRAAETAFFALLSRVMDLHRGGRSSSTGLPERHPILRFMAEAGKLAYVLDLDDTVLWGALPQLVDAADQTLARLATRVRDRKLPSCIDIRLRVEEALPPPHGEEPTARKARLGRIKLICENVLSALEERQAEISLGERMVLVDKYERSPYKRFDSARTPMNQIHIRHGDEVRDVAELSAVVAGAEPFEICRAYDFSGDSTGRDMVKNIIGTEIERAGRGDS